MLQPASIQDPRAPKRDQRGRKAVARRTGVSALALGALMVVGPVRLGAAPAEELPLPAAVTAITAQRSAPPCAAPAIGPRQEAAIEALLTVAPGTVGGVTTGDLQVGSAAIVGHYMVAPRGRGRRAGEPVEAVLLLVHPREARALGAEDVRLPGLAGWWVLPCVNTDAAAHTTALAARMEALGATTATQACGDGSLRGAMAAIGAALAEGAAEHAGPTWVCPASAAPATGDPESAGAVLARFDRALAVADRDAAEQALDGLLGRVDLNQLGPVERFDVATALLRLDRGKEARELLKAAIIGVEEGLEGLSAEQANAAIERAAAGHVHLGQIDAGVAVLDACRERDPRPTACSGVPFAGALEAAGKQPRATKVLDAELARFDRPPAALFLDRIGLASRMSDGATEVRVARAALAAWPDEPRLVDALATALFRVGEHTESIRLFERLYALAPRMPGVLARLSGVFNDMGGATNRPNGPIEAWKALREEMRARAAKDPNDVIALFLEGVSRFYDADFDGAIQAMKEVEPRVHNEARVFIYQAMGHFWAGRQSEAETQVERAHQANAHDPDVYYCISQIWRKKDLPRATEALRRYVALSAAPGALQFVKKTERVKQELAMLERGELPPVWWDRPKAEGNDANRLKDPFVMPSPWVGFAGLAALLAGLGLGWYLRRRT